MLEETQSLASQAFSVLPETNVWMVILVTKTGSFAKPNGHRPVATTVIAYAILITRS
jgi:hypothetical protein